MNKQIESHFLTEIFRAYFDLTSYMINLGPDNAQLYYPIDPISADTFFEQFWFCKEDFSQLDLSKDCTLVFLPDRQAIMEEEFKRHAVYLSSYYAWKNSKQFPIALEGYITQYNSRECSFSLAQKTDDIKDRIRLLQSSLASPFFNIPFYKKDLLKNEIASIFNATAQKGYFLKQKNIFSEQALAMLLGRLLYDGGNTDQKIFYAVCNSENQVFHMVHLHRAIRNLLQSPGTAGISPQISFPLIVFCHTPTISNGSQLAEQLPAHNDYWLFDGPYYKSDHFKGNLNKRIDQVNKYYSMIGVGAEQKRIEKLQAQLQWIKHYCVKEDSGGYEPFSLHKLIHQVDMNWNDLSA